MKLTLEQLEKHQKETLETLNKQIELIEQQIEALENSRQTIANVKAKFMSQIFLRKVGLI